jgi:hypothetical protein
MLRLQTRALLLLSLCFAFVGGGFDLAAARTPRTSTDSVWMHLMSFQTHETFYFDIGRDGQILAVREDGRSFGFSDLRSGKLSAELTERVFSVVTSKEVLGARDTEPGEQLFSDSEWVSLGLLIDERVTDLWGFREELKDYPEKFRRLVSELKSLSGSLPAARNTKAVIYSRPVDARRAQSIREDARRFYDFVPVGEGQLSALPSLARALRVANRRIPVESSPELETLKAFLKESNLRSTGTDFFVEHGGRIYQIELRMRAAPRVIM